MARTDLVQGEDALLSGKLFDDRGNRMSATLGMTPTLAGFAPAIPPPLATKPSPYRRREIVQRPTLAP